MNSVSPETLLAALEWRYATKKFDPNRRIPAPVWAALEKSLVLTPSSYGLQPWKFVVVTDPGAKRALVPHSWNQSQPLDCSHFVVFAARQTVDEAYVDRFVARTCSERGLPPDALAGYRNMMVGDVVNGPRGKQAFEWATRQAYIALGQFMASAAILGIDACPMEGIVPARYDEVLELAGTGYATVVACAAGYRAGDDKYSAAKKIRFPAAEIIKTV
jgi:nitroreductase